MFDIPNRALVDRRYDIVAMIDFSFWTTLLLLDFLGVALISLQAPIFPTEALTKGLSVADYGLIAAAFFLGMLITCLFLSKYLTAIGVTVSMLI